MLPVLYLSIPTYMLMACIGLCFALLFIYRKKVRLQWNMKIIMEYLLVCTILGFICSRILFVISIIPSMEQITINELVYYLVNGGLVFYGGLFGVLGGIVLVTKYKRENIREVLDFITPAFPLFHAFARFGCLLAGCCYGREWSWGVIMANEPDVIRFPVQLIESFCDLVIFIALLVLENKRKTSKYNLYIYLCSYAICRFILEFYRGDKIRGIWFGGLSTAQYISVLVLLVCGVSLVYKKFKKTGKSECEL